MKSIIYLQHLLLYVALQRVTHIGVTCCKIPCSLIFIAAADNNILTTPLTD